MYKPEKIDFYYTLIIVFLLFSECSFSQNWELGQSGKRYFYKIDSSFAFSSGDPFYNQVTGFTYDTSVVVGTDTVNTPNSQFYFSWFRFCDSIVSNPFGNSHIINAQNFIILNKDGDSIYFPKNTKDLANQKLYEFQNGNYFEANSVFFDTLRFKGSLDSIQYISIVLKDSLGNSISSVFNDTIINSKNNGFISTFNWNEFPNSNTFKYNQLEFDLLTNAETFNYSVGDEFHIVTSPASGPPSYSNITIMSRANYADSIIYNRNIVGQYISVDYSTNPPTSQTNYSNFNDTLIIYDLNTVIGNMPYKKGLNPSTQLSNYAQMKILSNPTNLLGYTLERAPYYDSISNCHFYPGSSTYFRDTYIKGCGMFREQWVPGGSGLNDFRTSLLYYKKGNKTWGTPNPISGIEKFNDANISLPFYPNPTSSLVSIPNSSQTAEILLYDLNGRLLKVWENPIEIISLEEFNTGLYLLEFRFVTGEIKREKLIIKK